ncbi:riboflavin synthase [Lyngbya confervoides]|uniref:Riboflavin synthase n=1 Tax=Lyngbya confervoides BDU141951 TaxID=1574623 RepID=A0ABD4T9Z9_9CYAN|nr:riboflavin synthase [Lyngbya confervoides]MCM1985230.1 riboflavin synthase [Lyngbya confervoides BDU141951]
MFTGLIQGQGQLRSWGTHQVLVQTTAPAVLAGLTLGDSVAVDGVCLTVETLVSEGFVVTTSPETLDRSTLAQSLDTPWQVNLEPALRVGDRLGGHFVTGHVDGMGKILDIQTLDNSWIVAVQSPPNLAKLIVSKGSIALNGISLTVADCDRRGDRFTVAVIPHSFALTNLQALAPGIWVNLETDVLGKYVEKLIQGPSPSDAASSPINTAFLLDHGYLR